MGQCNPMSGLPFDLIRHLNSAGPLSIPALAGAMGRDDAEISEALGQLKSLGVGYRLLGDGRVALDPPLEPLSESRVLGLLDPDTRSRIPRFELLDAVDSTNRRLLNEAEQGAPSGTVCLAECQTGGYGRRQRPWISPYGCNVYLSMYLDMPGDMAGWGVFSLWVGLHTVQALTRRGVAGLCLKWPNDLMHDDAKLGGILIQNARGRTGAVVGVGLNVLMAADVGKGIDQPWICLEKASGRPGPSRAETAAAVIEGILAAWDALGAQGSEGVVPLWVRYDCTLGKRVRVTGVDGETEGIDRGVDELGRLLLQTDSGIEAFSAGDVSLRWA